MIVTAAIAINRMRRVLGVVMAHPSLEDAGSDNRPNAEIVLLAYATFQGPTL